MRKISGYVKRVVTRRRSSSALVSFSRSLGSTSASAVTTLAFASACTCRLPACVARCLSVAAAAQQRHGISRGNSVRRSRKAAQTSNAQEERQPLQSTARCVAAEKQRKRAKRTKKSSPNVQCARRKARQLLQSTADTQGNALQSKQQSTQQTNRRVSRHGACTRVLLPQRCGVSTSAMLHL